MGTDQCLFFHVYSGIRVKLKVLTGLLLLLTGAKEIAKNGHVWRF